MRRTAIISAALAAALAPAASAAADPGDPISTWVPDGPVHAVAVQGSTAYLGGRFTSLAPFTGGAIAVTPSSDQPRAPWPDVDGQVYAVESDGAGGWYLGGFFSAVGGVPRTNLAHVRADGTLDPTWAPTTDGVVRVLAHRQGRLYLGGSFSRVNDITHRGIAELDAPTGAATTLPLEINSGEVYALTIGGTAQNPVLYAGGSFQHVSNQARPNVAAWSLPNGQLTAWNPSPNGPVFALAAGHGRVYVGGQYDRINQIKANRSLSATDPATGALVTTWRPNFVGGASIHALDVHGDVVYAGGSFSRAGEGFPTEADRHAAAAFTSDGTMTAWDPDVDGPVDTLDASASGVYLGGRFAKVKATARPNAAAVNLESGALLAWNPQPRGPVDDITADGDAVVVGGTFTSAGGVERTNLGAIDLATGLPTPFRADTNDRVHALAASADGLWVGGVFTRVGGTARKHLAEVDPATGALRTFDQPLVGGVLALAVSGRTVYAGGDLTAVGTTPRGRAAAFNAPSGSAGQLLPFDPGANTRVLALGVGDGRVYLGGTFTTLQAGAVARRGLAAVDPGSGAPAAWNPQLNGDVYGLTTRDGVVAAAGQFDAAGAVARMGVAVLDAGSAAPTAFDAQLNRTATAVAVADGQVVAGGYFSRSREERRRSFGAFDLGTGLARPWAPTLAALGDVAIQSLAVQESAWLVAGGDFLLADGPVRTARFAAFPLPAPTPAPGGPTAPATPGGAGGGTTDRTAPRITRLAASRTRFRVGPLPKRGTRLSLTLSEPARVTFEALAVTRGRKAGTQCVRATKANRRRKPCQLLRQRIRFVRQLPAGTSRLAFTGKTGTKAVGRGTHVLRATPTDAAGNTGPARTLRLRVTR